MSAPIKTKNPSPLSTISIAVLGMLMSVPVLAHEVWVTTGHTHGGEILQANLGYGEFPNLLPIAPDRLPIFKKPLQLVTETGRQNLVQKGKYNYQYETIKPVKDGSYLVLAEYSPTFWSENKDGWKQVNMKKMPDASYCEQTRMYGKNIVNVGHNSRATSLITQPVGQGFEIVPLANPATIKVGEPFAMKVLLDGEPVANETVVATFEGFTPHDPNDKVHKVEPQAFSDTTRADGTVKLYPLRQGFWKVRVVHKTDFKNPTDKSVQCQKQANYATLSFYIGEDND